jgi:hypothetical protein
MKGLVKYGLAVAMVFATAMPAMARSWVVCVDTTKDARFSTEATAGNNLSSLLRRRFILATQSLRLRPTARPVPSRQLRSARSLLLAAASTVCRTQI